MSCSADDALVWYCEECGDNIPLGVEHIDDAEIGGFFLDGLHVHFGGEIVELPRVSVGIYDMSDWNKFAEVMRAVKQDVQDHE
jgi:hypothetical protein